MFRIEINTDNAAFEDLPGPELAQMLRNVAARLDSSYVQFLGESSPIFDSNGNRVGYVVAEDVARLES